MSARKMCPGGTHFPRKFCPIVLTNSIVKGTDDGLHNTNLYSEYIPATRSLFLLSRVSKVSTVIIIDL